MALLFQFQNLHLRIVTISVSLKASKASHDVSVPFFSLRFPGAYYLLGSLAGKLDMHKTCPAGAVA